MWAVQRSVSPLRRIQARITKDGETSGHPPCAGSFDARAALNTASDFRKGAWPTSCLHDSPNPRSFMMQLAVTERSLRALLQVQLSVPTGCPSGHLPPRGKEYQLPTSKLELHCPCRAPLPRPMALS